MKKYCTEIISSSFSSGFIAKISITPTSPAEYFLLTFLRCKSYISVGLGTNDVHCLQQVAYAHQYPQYVDDIDEMYENTCMKIIDKPELCWVPSPDPGGTWRCLTEPEMLNTTQNVIMLWLHEAVSSPKRSCSISDGNACFQGKLPSAAFRFLHSAVACARLGSH